MRNSIISLDKEIVHIEVMAVKPSFHVNISEPFTIRECMRPSFEGSVNMDLEDVDEDDYLRKEVSCSKTTLLLGFPIQYGCGYHAHV